MKYCVSQLQVDGSEDVMNDNRDDDSLCLFISQVTDMVTAIVPDVSYKANSHLQPHDDDDDDDCLMEVMDEDTDEEYVPHALPPTSSTHKGRRKGPTKAVNKENGERAAKGSTKGSVQCPTCNKTFLSKYYLKVHNRYIDNCYHIVLTLPITMSILNHLCLYRFVLFR